MHNRFKTLESEWSLELRNWAQILFYQNMMSINLNWVGLRDTQREQKDGGGGVMCVCVCDASRSASSDLPPLFKCWKRQFACCPPAFSARRSVWSNLPFQTHFYLIASSETKWHRGRMLGLECRCNTNTVHPQIENEEWTKERGIRKKTFLTSSTCSGADKMSGVSEEVEERGR